MSNAMSTAKVFVYCENHNTRVPVADFVYTEGQWREVGRDSSVRIATGEQSGREIVLIGPNNRRADTRKRPNLQCRKRKCRRSVPVNDEGKLFRVLDAVVARGDSSVSLSELAAII